MTAQEVARELGVRWHGAKYVYCGRCATARPGEPLRRRLRRRSAVGDGQFRFLGDFFDEPGALSCLEYVDPEPHPVDQPRDWWKRASPQNSNGRALRDTPQRRSDHPRPARRRRRIEIARKDPPNQNQIVHEALGFQRSTDSPLRLSLVRLEDDERRSTLTCWMCGTRMHVPRAPRHSRRPCQEVRRSDPHLSHGIAVRDSTVPFPHRNPIVGRSRRLRGDPKAPRSADWPYADVATKQLGKLN